MNVDRILKDAKSSGAVLSGTVRCLSAHIFAPDTARASLLTLRRTPARAPDKASSSGGTKRKREDAGSDSDDAVPTIDGSAPAKRSRMAEFLESAEDVLELDAGRLRDLVSRFTRAIEKNMEMRVKFADEPARFMESELALHTLLQELHALPAAPELYAEFVKLKAVEPLLGLLPHENTDISVEVVDLLKELTEPDVFSDDDESDAEALLDSLLRNRMLQLLVSNLERLDEAQGEDRQAVHNTLEIIENLMGMQPHLMSDVIARDTKMLDYLIRRLGSGAFDENKLYCSEITSMLLMNGEQGEARRRARGAGCVGELLRAVGTYLKREPANDDEVELVENMFDSLCALVQDSKEAREELAAADGMPLLIRLVRRRRATRAPALKLLSYTMSDHPGNCALFIDAGGLKSIFSAFMAKGKVPKKLRAQAEKSEEHILACIAQLFVRLSDMRYLRTLNKFRENEYEKVERLAELYEKYYRRLEDSEAEWKTSHPGKTEDPDERYERRLDVGLFPLQLCALIIALVSSAGDRGICQRVEQVLNQQDSSLADVKQVLEEYAANMGEDTAESRMRLILTNVRAILDRMVGGVAADDGADAKQRP